MKPFRYVILNPSGNLTALVTEWGGAEDETAITARLMRESEQVAYLDPPMQPGALARIRLMGGEFCGNAAMAAAGWLVRDRLLNGQEMTVPVEVSGAQGVLFCRIRRLEDGFEGTVEMPRENREPLEKEKAEALLKAFAEKTDAEAAGLLDRNPETGFMRPLVYVRGSGTMVWESACGSGTAAIGALEAWRRGNGKAETQVGQPGGVRRAEAVSERGSITEVQITGVVRIGKETES